MSWFTDLAGKAEELLNKVDKSAAVVFNKDEDTPTSRISNFRRGEYERTIPVSSSLLTTATYLPSPSYSSGSPTAGEKSRVLNSSPSVSIKQKSSLQKTSDEKLLEFLNSDEPSKKQAVSKQVSKIKMDIPSTTSNVELKSSNLELDDNSKISTNIVDSDAVAKEDEKQILNLPLIESEPEESLKELKNDPNPVNVDVPVSLNPRSLEFENQLFKKEITSLNQELNLATEKSKQQQNEIQRLNKEIERQSLQLSGEDKILQELQNRESDFKQALDAKDSQLAVLRVRLQEADLDISRTKDTLDKLQKENIRLLEDHSSSSDLHSQALYSLQQRLQQAEDLMERERCNFRSTQNENLQRIENLEADIRNMASNLNEAQTKLVEEKSRNSELCAQLKSSKQSEELVQQELADYKLKAQRILQSKDKLISTLKGASIANGNKLDQLEISVVEFEELKHERDDLKEELLQANQQVVSLRTEIQEMEAQMQEEVLLMREHNRELEKNLQEEKENKKEREREMFQLKEDIQYERESHNRQKATLQSRIQDRDNEIEKLRNQLIAKHVNSTSQAELEARLRTLTESLIQKQTMLEALSTEKSSLVLQLERLEHSANDPPVYVRRNTTMSVNVHDDNDVRLRVPGFMDENPFDGQMTRKVKRVYNTIDTLSFRLGVFLRRYPMARILIIIYMIMLHLWVLIVLLTYTPEAHPVGYMHEQTGHKR